MIEVLADLSLIYLFSFFSGIGLYEFIVPTIYKTRSLFLLLPAGLGILLTSIISAYLVYASLNINFSIYISLGIGACTLTAALLRSRGHMSDFYERLRDIGGISSVKIVLFVALLAVLLAPVLNAGMPTTPYRIGIDQVGYAESAQFLVEGGTLAKARANLLTGLQTHDLALAEAKNVRSLNFGTYVDTEFLLKAMRWGFPGVVASMTELTRSGHVFRIEFLLLILSYAVLIGLVVHTLRRHFMMPFSIAFAIAAALALNCNLLNVYYEGELSEIFILPYFLMIFIVFLDARVVRTTSKSLFPNLLADSQPILLLAFLTAGMFSAYNESMVLIFALLYLIVFLDFCFYRRTSQRAMLVMASGLGMGFVAILPVSWRWFVYTAANLQGLARAGFWQPHWASLAEILGLLNMYTQVGYQLLGRSIGNEVVSIGLSLVAVALMLRFILKAKDLDRSFWVAPFVLILAIYLKTHFIDGILNYPYMKVYTMLTPLLVVPAFAALYDYARQKGSFVKFVQYFALATVMSTGLIYIGQYLAQGHYVTRDMFSMYQYNGARRFDRYAIITPQQIIASYMLSPLISMNWLNQSTVPTYIAPAMSKKVIVVLSNDQLTCRICFIMRYGKQIVYSNPSYIFVDTGMTVARFCPVDAAAYKINADRRQWTGLPMNQCKDLTSLNLSYLQAAPQP